MRIYNSISRSKEEFVPRVPGKVAMYVCGPTVYNHIHIGNARTFLSFDVVRRYLAYRGYDVTFVQNITDVDDKIINRANEEGRSAEEVAAEYSAAFIAAMRRLGVEDPDVRPLATAEIPSMIELISRLIDSEHAYAVDGDVYFSVRSFPEYGKLSGRDVDDLLSGARIEVDERKRDPLDFALWKAAKPGEPSWDSPWGAGRPGWHIECSAMSEEHLSLPLDIHGGGSDLAFPHHENEIAQTEAATGTRFANYWMHGGMLQVNSEKMSKSLGNFLLIKDVLDARPAAVVRLLMLQTHYRSPLDFSESRLDEAAVSLERITTAVRNLDWQAARPDGDAGAAEADRDAFVAAIEAARKGFVDEMDDDFNTAGALGAVFSLVTEANAFLAACAGDCTVRDAELLTTGSDTIVGLLGVLGIEIERGDEGFPVAMVDLARELAGYEGSDPDGAVGAMLELRGRARLEKRWDVADAVRDRLGALGYVVEDTPSGARIVRKD